MPPLPAHYRFAAAFLPYDEPSAFTASLRHITSLRCVLDSGIVPVALAQWVTGDGSGNSLSQMIGPLPSFTAKEVLRT